MLLVTLVLVEVVHGPDWLASSAGWLGWLDWLGFAGSAASAGWAFASPVFYRLGAFP